MRTQTVRVNIPNSTPAGLYDRLVTLDSSFKRVKGIGIPAPKLDSHYLNAADFQVGVKTNDQGVIHDLTSIQALIFSPPQPVSDRFLKVDFPITKDQITVSFRLAQAATQDLSFDLVFILEK